jgi:hypothetical protein
MNLSTRQKAYYTLAISYAIALIITIFVFMFRNEQSKYFRFGPNDDLIIISILINTWGKWVLAILFIGVVKCCEVIVNELGNPIIVFRVYNPDCKVITDFTKNELNIITNAMWFVNDFRKIIMIVVSITQVDLAIMSLMMSEVMSIITVRILLNDKVFTN